MNIITPPCDYKPFDQSAGSSVRTCFEHGEVLNLVYVLEKFCQFVGSGSYKPTSDTYALVAQSVRALGRWFESSQACTNFLSRGSHLCNLQPARFHTSLAGFFNYE